MKSINTILGACGLALMLVASTVACSEKKDKEMLSNFPAEADPVAIGVKITRRFLEQPHSQYGSPLRINEPRTQISYPDVCTWLGALWFSKVTDNRLLFGELKERFEPLFTSEAYLQPLPNHVDNNVFGALALELYMQTQEERYKEMGMMYADTQWQLPAEGYTATERAWADNDYSWQTRIWLDDMFMITAVQAQAYRITGNRDYVDRSAREMVLYLDSIQLSNGLFYHSPEAKFCWGRGNGWMAVGMAELLRILPNDNEHRPAIMAAYLKMMATLKEYQDKNGMWKQLIDDATLWDETSGTGMFTYAMIVGVKKGWLNKKEYEPVAHKAWLALSGFIDEKGDVESVCEGTNIGFSTEYYRNRLPLTGDLHGQAPMLWCAYALLSDKL